MATEKNLILHLPFDDPDGTTAYDYSQSRADATLSDGADFTKEAYKGKAIAFNGNGEALTSKVIPFSSDFTLTCYVRPASSRIGWLLNLPGVDSYLEQWIDVAADVWTMLSFVKSGRYFIVYKDKERIYKELLPNTPTGLSLNDENIDGTEALLDEVRLYNAALTEQEVLALQKDTDVEYYVDGENIKDYHVYVSSSKGLVGQLARKDGLQTDWEGYHGIARDKKRKRYKERTITLECFIEAPSRSAYIERVTAFFKLFEADGNHRLKIEYDGDTKPLVYEVEIQDEVDPTKTWGRYNNDLMVGTFTLKLLEDEPVKRVLRHIGTTANSVASVTFTSYKMFNIYWGDGTSTYNVSGTSKTVEHTYEEAGTYDIVIAGVIEVLEDFSTNAIVVWEILK